MKTEMTQERFNQFVREFSEKELEMDYFLVYQKGKTYRHRFKEQEEPSDIRSISKTVLTLIAGVVSQKYPTFNEETYIYPILQDKIEIRDEENKEKFKKLQIKHLITHTMGYDKVLLMRGDIAGMDPYSYVDYVVNEPLVHEPGEYYLYSNAGFYLLSVVLEEFLQEDLTTFSACEFFSPLGIEEFTWEKYGNYLAGATRLWLYPEDLSKIGQLFLTHGKVGDTQLLEKSWLEKMSEAEIKTPHIDTPERIFRRYAYGMGMWTAKDHVFFGHGTDGQIMVVVPEAEMMIVTLARQDKLAPIEDIVDVVVSESI